VIIYAALSGLAPSTQRAVIMVIIFLLTLLVEREHDLINTLVTAALIILIINPTAVFSIAFQLSFTSVLSIFFGMYSIGYQKPVPTNLKTFFVNYGKSLFLASCFAVIGTAPLVMFYFNQISFWGILSNLLFIPLIGFVIVPLSLFSVLFLFPVSMIWASWGLYFCSSLIEFAIKIAFQFSYLPFSSIKFFSPSMIEIICIYFLLWCIGTLMFNRIQSNLKKSVLVRAPHAAAPSKSDRPDAFHTDKISYFSNKTHLIKLLMAMICIILIIDISYWINRRFFSEKFRATILDVGQGNSALIELPLGKCILIDGGGFSDNAIFDVGKYVVAPFLWKNKIHTIDIVILTHPDSDHLNGLTYILKNFTVKKIISNGDTSTSKEFAHFQEIIANKQIIHRTDQSLLENLNINNVNLRFLSSALWHPTQFQGLPWKNRNNNSLVIQVRFRKKSILFPGDIMKPAEYALIQTSKNKLKSTILIAPHHGSKTSSSFDFLRAVDPVAIIVSSGKNNRFGFPSKEVIDRCVDLGIEVFRTDKNGAIHIIIDDNGLNIQTINRDRKRISE